MMNDGENSIIVWFAIYISTVASVSGILPMRKSFFFLSFYIYRDKKSILFGKKSKTIFISN